MNISFAVLLEICLIILPGGFIAFAQTKSVGAQKPNILIILADDLGYSDLGCYGSEISTPNLDALAGDGHKFPHFYNSARCCPSRAALLTGRHPHETGMGGMVSFPKPGKSFQEGPYQGFLSKDFPTMAEIFKLAGYKTLMAGKWHVGESKGNWPLQRQPRFSLLPMMRLTEIQTTPHSHRSCFGYPGIGHSKVSSVPQSSIWTPQCGWPRPWPGCKVPLSVDQVLPAA
jgi:arylsulfatase A-like enzyme